MKHHAALLEMGVDAVPAIANKAIYGHNSYSRDNAILLLREIGDPAWPLVREMVDQPSKNERIEHNDVRGRVLYALFIAFEDWDAFEKWLDYAKNRGRYPLHESKIEYHIQDYEFSERHALVHEVEGEYIVSPKLIDWFKENKSNSQALIKVKDGL